MDGSGQQWSLGKKQIFFKNLLQHTSWTDDEMEILA
jgi:hypothetical protein